MRDGGVDLLIDAARDVLEALMRQSPELGHATAEKWFSSSSPLLRRLAIHGLGIDRAQSPDERIAWLLERDLLYKAPLKHEVFKVLASALPNASTDSRSSVIKRAKRGLVARDYPRLSKRTREYERYNLLFWISEALPDDTKARKAFETEQQRHPDFSPRSSPDLDISEPEFNVVPRSHGGVEDVEKKPPNSETARWLLSLVEDKDIDEWGPDRIGVAESVSSATAKNPRWGLAFARSLRDEGISAVALWSGLINGWTGKLNESQWQQAFYALGVVVDEPSLALEATRLLVAYVESLDSYKRRSLRAAERLSDKIWAAAETKEKSAVSGTDWLTWAINHPGGKLAEFWLRALALRNVDGARVSIPPSYKKRLAKVVAESGNLAQAGRVFLASQLHFLYSIDKAWTARTVVPLFEWSREGSDAEKVWDGYLTWGRLNESVIELMLPLYEQSFPMLTRNSNEWRDHFTRHLALIAVRSTRNPLRDRWLPAFVNEAPAEDRALWCRHVGFELRELDDEARAVQWEKWISAYWDDRLRGVPRRLTKVEASDMSLWVVVMRRYFVDAVDRATRSPATSPIRVVYDFLSEGDFAKTEPAAAASYIAHLLAGEREPFYECSNVLEFMSDLVGQDVDPSYLRIIREEGLRLGCTEVLSSSGS